jgi:hypothetical protein
LPWKHSYPSAGSTYAVQLYVIAPGGLRGGGQGQAWYYNPDEHALAQTSVSVSLGAAPQTLREAFMQAAGSTSTADASSRAYIVAVACLPAIVPLYGDAALPFCHLEGGMILSTLDASGKESGLKWGINAASTTLLPGEEDPAALAWFSTALQLNKSTMDDGSPTHIPLSMCAVHGGE